MFAVGSSDGHISIYGGWPQPSLISRYRHKAVFRLTFFAKDLYLKVYEIYFCEFPLYSAILYHFWNLFKKIFK